MVPLLYRTGKNTLQFVCIGFKATPCSVSLSIVEYTGDKDPLCHLFVLGLN